MRSRPSEWFSVENRATWRGSWQYLRQEGNRRKGSVDRGNSRSGRINQLHETLERQRCRGRQAEPSIKCKVGKIKLKISRPRIHTESTWTLSPPTKRRDNVRFTRKILKASSSDSPLPSSFFYFLHFYLPLCNSPPFANSSSFPVFFFRFSSPIFLFFPESPLSLWFFKPVIPLWIISRCWYSLTFFSILSRLIYDILVRYLKIGINIFFWRNSMEFWWKIFKYRVEFVSDCMKNL